VVSSDGVPLHILTLQRDLRDEFFAASKLLDGAFIHEFDTFSKFLKAVKTEEAASSNLIMFLPKRRFDSRKTRLVRLARLESPLYVVSRECTEKDQLTYLTLGVTAVLQPPFGKPEVQQVLNGREGAEVPFPRSVEVIKEGQARLDFLMPSRLSRILGVNRLVSFLANEFGFPPEDSKVNLPLVMDEALSNAIVHGNKNRDDRKVHVRIYVSCHRFFVQVEDEGEGFESDDTEDPKALANLHKPSGRGIYLMRELMDRVTFKNGGRLVELEKKNPFNGGSCA
jgi:anti-sigma regulatory factor (Ser/Thr protein kinase)